MCWLHLLSWCYGVVIILRNFLYNTKIKRSRCYTKPLVIGVGNLSVGGTGKTPFVIYLTQWLVKHKVVALLSRGYKRTSSGFKVINAYTSALTSGDEPYLLYQKFACNPNVVIAVCENRAEGIAKIMAYRPDVEVVLLDDAFQHRCIIPNLNILLTTFDQPFFKDYLLPLGRLREPRKGVARADMILVTNSPANLTKAQMDNLKADIQKNHPSASPIFFSHVVYHAPIAMGATTSQKDTLPHSLVLFTGIAHPLPLRTYLESRGHNVLHLTFPDHHWFTYRDILKIIDSFHACKDPYKAMVTTEKDHVRLMGWHSLLAALPIFYIPIEVAFASDQNTLEEKIAAILYP